MTAWKELVARTPLPDVWADIRDYVRKTPGKSLLVMVFAPLLVALTMRLTKVEVAQAVVLRVIGPRADSLYRWYFTFGAQFVLLYLIPVICIKAWFKEPLSEYGHQLAPVMRLWPLLVVFLAIMLPVTYVMSRQPGFKHFYPLYKGSYLGWGRFLVFEIGYFSLFISQEFFFRGFVIEALKPHMGKSAILFSTAIYAIGHCFKPFPEQLGAFVVGTLLGYIGDRYRTFYFGVIIHYLVSLAMDSYLVVPALLSGGPR